MNTTYYKDPKPKPPERKVYSVKEVSLILGMSDVHILNAIKQDRLPFAWIKVMGRYAISKADVDAAVEGRRPL